MSLLGFGGGRKVLRAVHYSRLEFAKEFARQDLGEEVGRHFLGRTVAHVYPSLLDVVGDREEFDVEVSRTLSGRAFPVHLKFHGAEIVLVKAAVGVEALCLDEERGVDHLREGLVDAVQLGSRGAVRHGWSSACLRCR